MSKFKFGAIDDDAAALAPSHLNGDGASVAGFSKNNPAAARDSTGLPRMVPPRKRKMVQAAPTTETFSIGNCIVEFPSDADQEITAEKLVLQLNQFASVKISVDKLKTKAPETPNPCAAGQTLPPDISFQLINPKSLDKINGELLESTTQLYKQELPAMNFAADTGKESDFLRNCTMNGKYCSLLLKKPGESPADPEIVVGAITYQILPTSTQYAEIPLAAVDQSCQRQGLGKLLVGELARRLMDVGVLTLFCWGDQESEKFWNKQGFLKIAEVNAQGKPQKLRLKNEIRKAMSLPGNSALMVCNLPHLNTRTPMSAGWNTHQTPIPKNVTPTIEKELKVRRKTAHAGAEQSPIAHSDVLDPYSFENIPSKTPISSDMSPAPAEPLPSCHIRDGANSKGRTSSSKLSVMANPTTGSTSSPAKSNRTLRFADIDRVTVAEKEVSESPSLVFPGQLVSTVACEDSGPAVKPCTERLCEEKVTPTVTIDFPSNIDVGCREPLGNVQNVSAQDVVAPVKKRPWRRTQCDNPKVTSTIGGPQSADTGCGPGKENKELARKDVSAMECDGTVNSSKSRRKRPRAEAVPEKTPGTRSVGRPRRDSTSITNPVLQTSEPQLPDYTSISEQAVTSQKAGAVNPVFQAPSSFSEHVPPAREAGAANPAIQTPEPKPVSSSEQVVTTQKPGIVNHAAVLNRQTGSDTRDAKAVDCTQSVAHELFSPSSLGEQHMNMRLQKQGKGSTIRKRLSTRLVHVPDVGEYSPLASGFIKDFAKATPPVVFLMNMPNDPKKKALAQLVEKLGGKVTGDGGECTHVIANEVRRTLNFCTALCKGAWVVTPDWLKASNRHKSFVGEESYLLRDKHFESKYKVSLATAIQAAQRKPRSLFAGFSVYPTPHVQPPLDIVTKLTKAAGGRVLSSLDEALQQIDTSRTIVLTCDEDKEEGDVATKAGLRTFEGEWLMQTIVKQSIDFDTVIPSDH